MSEENIKPEEVTQDYEKDETEAFDITNDEELDRLIAETTGGNYFNPEDGKKYKVRLKDSKMYPVTKEFNGEEQTKWQVNVSVKEKDGEFQDKVWEMSSGVANEVAKCLKNSDKPPLETDFYVERKGTGLQTKYTIYIPEAF